MTTSESQEDTPPAPPAGARRKRRPLLRHFMMQLIPVTAGILIALLIDGLLEVRRQDELVAEAHAAMAAEIADNAKQLDNALPSLDTVVATLGEMQGAIDEIFANGTTAITHGSFGLIMPSLSRASWESAERTGALSYMDYEQVRRYAGLYAGQDQILTSYDDLLRRFPTLGSIGETLQSKDRATRRDDLGRGRGVIAEFMIAIGSHRAMAQGLKFRYQRMPCYLDECPEPAVAPAP